MNGAASSQADRTVGPASTGSDKQQSEIAQLRAELAALKAANASRSTSSSSSSTALVPASSAAALAPALLTLRTRCAALHHSAASSKHDVLALTTDFTRFSREMSSALVRAQEMMESQRKNWSAEAEERRRLFENLQQLKVCLHPPFLLCI